MGVALAQTTVSTCPIATEGESIEDCPWSEVGRELHDLASATRPTTPKILWETLKTRLPALATQIERDEKREELKRLWTHSQNYDEFAKAEILHPWVINALEGAFGVFPSRGREVHAGLEHVYGYLFSILKTPFGYKRARWVRGQIERGLGLPEGLLSPATSEGTLFANVTYLAAKIALRDDAGAQKALKTAQTAVSKKIKSLSLAGRPVFRVTETATAKDAMGARRLVEIRTDLVALNPLPAPPPAAPPPQAPPQDWLLVYSVKDPSMGPGAKLVTLFPVDAAFKEKMLASGVFGSDKPVQARYNAWIPGLMDAPVNGKRNLHPSSL